MALHDVDAAQRGRLMKAAAWGGIPGIVLGPALGLALGSRLESGGGLLVLGGLVLGPILGTLIPFYLTEWIGNSATILYNPSGSSTPYQRTHSQIDALIVRERWDEAATALRKVIDSDPSDPEGYLRLGRLYRDGFRSPEEAVDWLRLGRDRSPEGSGERLRATREIIEIFTHTLHEERRAAPELARLAAEFPDHPQAEWARKELQAIKEAMREAEGRG